MYDAYGYTSAAGLALRKDYTDYKGKQGDCDYKGEHSHFKNLGMVEQ